MLSRNQLAKLLAMLSVVWQDRLSDQQAEEMVLQESLLATQLALVGFLTVPVLGTAA